MEPDSKKISVELSKKSSVEKGKKSVWLLIAMAGLSGYLGGRVAINSDSSASTKSLTPEVRQQIVSTESQAIAEVAKTTGESVVSVNVTSEVQGSGSFFGFDSGPSQQQSAGTGVIINKEGIIITNRHVVPKGSTTVSVTLSDGTELTDVEVIGRTRDVDTLDIAFLKIKDAKGKELKPAKIGDSSTMKIGDKVVAIGNALGRFQNTVTSGIVSGYGRDIRAQDASGGSAEQLTNLFQTDTAINQGNSGGPLVNLSGEVIGINTAVAGGENLGFAIPINDAKGLIKSVLEKGKLLRPYLGVRYVTLTDDYAYQYNLDVKRGAYLAPSKNGVLQKDSPAEKAGLKEKDIITKIDDKEINEKNSLVSLVGQHSAEDTIMLTIVREGKEIKVPVKLEAAPEN